MKLEISKFNEIRKLMKMDPTMFEYLDEPYRNMKSIADEAIIRDPKQYQFIGDDLKHREYALNIVSIQPNVFAYLPETLKIDGSIMEKALQIPEMIQHLPDELYESKEFNVMLAEDYDISLEHLNKKFHSDKDIVKIRVQQKGRELEYADKILQDDVEVVMTAVQSDGHALIYCSDALKDNESIVAEAVLQNPNAIVFASIDIQEQYRMSDYDTITWMSDYGLSEEEKKTWEELKDKKRNVCHMRDKMHRSGLNARIQNAGIKHNKQKDKPLEHAVTNKGLER